MKTYLECDCHSFNHIIKLELDKEDSCWILYLHIFLTRHFSFWRRVWFSVKYIFNVDPPFGQYEEFVFNEKTATKFRDVLNECIEKEKSKNKVRRVELPKKWKDFVANLPETGMGYQMTTISTSDGQVFKKVCIQEGMYLATTKIIDVDSIVYIYAEDREGNIISS